LIGALFGVVLAAGLLLAAVVTVAMWERWTTGPDRGEPPDRRRAYRLAA
jgi:hypothetical protein